MYEFHTEPGPDLRIKRKINWWRTILSLIALVLLLSFASVIFPPDNFPAGTVVVIEEGSSLTTIASELETRGVVKSGGLFKSMVVFFGADKSIATGDYLFKQPVGVFEVARRVASGDFGVERIPVTLPEGLTVEEMADILDTKLPEFNSEEFMFLAQDKEGYMFPDTYLLFASTKTPDVFDIMKNTFDKKILKGFEKEFEKSERSISDIITMASIIEDEAFDGYEEKQIISGILWKRLDMGMMLQVDATLRYVNGKESKDMTLSDLAADHEYNTYKYKGLPPTPIGNPGVESVRAALNPKDSIYYFYLHDSEGKVHYAKTFEEHKKNIAAYLK